MGSNIFEPIDMTGHREVIDFDGDMDFSSNFEMLLVKLYGMNPLPEKRQRIKILTSRIGFEAAKPNDIPFRYSKEKVYTFAGLLRQYKISFRKTFNFKSYQEKELDREDKWEQYRKEGERRTAWGAYTQIMHLHKKEEQKEMLERMNPDERKKAIEKINKESSGAIMFIG